MVNGKFRITPALPLSLLEQREVHLSRLAGSEQQAREVPGGGHGRQDAGQSDLVPAHADLAYVYAVEVSVEAGGLWLG